MEVKMHYKNISEVRDEINDIKEPEGTLIDNKLILDLDKLHNNVSPPPELNEVCIYKTDAKRKKVRCHRHILNFINDVQCTNNKCHQCKRKNLKYGLIRCSRKECFNLYCNICIKKYNEQYDPCFHCQKICKCKICRNKFDIYNELEDEVSLFENNYCLDDKNLIKIDNFVIIEKKDSEFDKSETEQVQPNPPIKPNLKKNKAKISYADKIYTRIKPKTSKHKKLIKAKHKLQRKNKANKADCNIPNEINNIDYCSRLNNISDSLETNKKKNVLFTLETNILNDNNKIALGSNDLILSQVNNKKKINKIANKNKSKNFNISTTTTTINNKSPVIKIFADYTEKEAKRIKNKSNKKTQNEIEEGLKENKQAEKSVKTDSVDIFLNKDIEITDNHTKKYEIINPINKNELNTINICLSNSSNNSSSISKNKYTIKEKKKKTQNSRLIQNYDFTNSKSVNLKAEKILNKSNDDDYNNYKNIIKNNLKNFPINSQIKNKMNISQNNNDNSLNNESLKNIDVSSKNSSKPKKSVYKNCIYCKNDKINNTTILRFKSSEEFSLYSKHFYEKLTNESAQLYEESKSNFEKYFNESYKKGAQANNVPFKAIQYICICCFEEKMKNEKGFSNILSTLQRGFDEGDINSSFPNQADSSSGNLNIVNASASNSENKKLSMNPSIELNKLPRAQENCLLKQKKKPGKKRIKASEDNRAQKLNPSSTPVNFSNFSINLDLNMDKDKEKDKNNDKEQTSNMISFIDNNKGIRKNLNNRKEIENCSANFNMNNSGLKNPHPLYPPIISKMPANSSINKANNLIDAIQNTYPPNSDKVNNSNSGNYNNEHNNFLNTINISNQENNNINSNNNYKTLNNLNYPNLQKTNMNNEQNSNNLNMKVTNLNNNSTNMTNLNNSSNSSANNQKQIINSLNPNQNTLNSINNNFNSNTNERNAVLNNNDSKLDDLNHLISQGIDELYNTTKENLGNVTDGMNINNIIMNFDNNKDELSNKLNIKGILDDLKKQFFSINYYSLLQKLFISYIFQNLETFIEQISKNQIFGDFFINNITQNLPKIIDSADLKNNPNSLQINSLVNTINEQINSLKNLNLQEQGITSSLNGVFDELKTKGSKILENVENVGGSSIMQTGMSQVGLNVDSGNELNIKNYLASQNLIGGNVNNNMNASNPSINSIGNQHSTLAQNLSNNNNNFIIHNDFLTNSLLHNNNFVSQKYAHNNSLTTNAENNNNNNVSKNNNSTNSLEQVNINHQNNANVNNNNNEVSQNSKNFDSSKEEHHSINPNAATNIVNCDKNSMRAQINPSQFQQNHNQNSSILDYINNNNTFNNNVNNNQINSINSLFDVNPQISQQGNFLSSQNPSVQMQLLEKIIAQKNSNSQHIQSNINLGKINNNNNNNNNNNINNMTNNHNNPQQNVFQEINPLAFIQSGGNVNLMSNLLPGLIKNSTNQANLSSNINQMFGLNPLVYNIQGISSLNNNQILQQQNYPFLNMNSQLLPMQVNGMQCLNPLQNTISNFELLNSLQGGIGFNNQQNINGLLSNQQMNFEGGMPINQRILMESNNQQNMIPSNLLNPVDVNYQVLKQLNNENE